MILRPFLYAIAACAALMGSYFLPGLQMGQALSESGRTNLPFRIGERLMYNLSWGVISAGTAVLEIGDPEIFEGHPALRLMHTARSNAVVSAFFVIDDRLVSLVDDHTLLPYRLSFLRREGARRNDIEVLFDRDLRQASLNKDGRTEQYEIPPDAQDSLSWLYYIRTLPSSADASSVTVPIFHEGRNTVIEVRFEGIEHVTSGQGEVETVHVVAMMPPKGLFSNRGPIDVWLSNDAARVPILIKTKIVVGSIAATLISREGD
ncbi:MAG: DUF3108 domain-containing protein [Nitrospirae bacterium]|nr:MAG: DUF3108 domain-containing protein [Nitrospirota bacterium]